MCSVHHTLPTTAQEVASLLQERMPAGQADLLSDLLITGTEHRHPDRGLVLVAFDREGRGEVAWQQFGAAGPDIRQGLSSSQPPELFPYLGCSWCSGCWTGTATRQGPQCGCSTPCTLSRLSSCGSWWRCSVPCTGAGLLSVWLLQPAGQVGGAGAGAGGRAGRGGLRPD